MNVDSTNIVSSGTVDYSLLPDAYISFLLFIIAFLSFLFTLYKYRKLRKAIKPSFTNINLVDKNLLLIIIVSGFGGAIPHPKFFTKQLLLGFIPLRKFYLQSMLVKNKEEIENMGAKTPKTSFKSEQLFWVVIPESLKLSKGKYKIYANTSVGVCSTILQ